MTIDDAFFHNLAEQFPGKDVSPWFVYTAVIFQSNDRMDLLAPLWAYVDRQTSGRDEKLARARMLREAMLKASVLVGFPKGINACMALRSAIKTHTGDISADLDADKSLRSKLSRTEKDERGHAFFSKIYAQHTDRVLENMARASGGDLSEFAINAVYGDLMAETSRLGAKETGLLEFLACYAAGGSTWSQAKGHMYGSHNLGNGKAEILAAVSICKAIESELGIGVNRQPEENWNWLTKAEAW